MRLFIAINFTDEVKSKIRDAVETLKKSAVQGKFVEPEHMHLTLEFLGEVPPHKVDLIKSAMDRLDYNAFTLTLNKIGFFKRPEGKIYWLGLNHSGPLQNIQKTLHIDLMNLGFELEDREYKPHITLGRKVILKDGFNPADIQMNSVSINAKSIDLMKSEFLSGKLKYTLIHTTLLKQN